MHLLVWREIMMMSFLIDFFAMNEKDTQTDN